MQVTSLTGWIIIYLLDLLFWLWVVRWGGAEWLVGTFASGFLINFRAPLWDSDGIKLFGWLMLIISTILFVVGLFVPEMRWC
jgi:hypothetical protein